MAGKLISGRSFRDGDRLTGQGIRTKAESLIACIEDQTVREAMAFLVDHFSPQADTRA